MPLPCPASPSDDDWGNAAAAPVNAHQQPQQDQWGAAAAGGGYGAPPPAWQQQQYGSSDGGYGGPPPAQQQQQGAWGGGGGGGYNESAPADVLCPSCNNPCLMRTSNTPKNPNRWVLAPPGWLGRCGPAWRARVQRRLLAGHLRREEPGPALPPQCPCRVLLGPPTARRQFYKCPNEACRFFKWAGLPAASLPACCMRRHQQAPLRFAAAAARLPAPVSCLTLCPAASRCRWADELNSSEGGGTGGPSAKKGRMTDYAAGGGSTGGYGGGYGGYGAPQGSGGGGAFPAPGDSGTALRDRSNDVCYKVRLADCWVLAVWPDCWVGLVGCWKGGRQHRRRRWAGAPSF